MAIMRASVLLILTSVVALTAEKPPLKSLQAVADAYLAKSPAEPPPAGLSYETALESQKQYVNLLAKSFGKRAGYKIGLVTPAGQQRYHIAHPVRGVLFEKMLLPDKSRVPVSYGTRPIVEPDLLVRVKDEGINSATTLEQAAQHLGEIICFIELADGTFATNAAVDGGALTACNVGARAGILGQTRKLASSSQFIEAFGSMSLIFRDRDGKELSRVKADGIMGHPLNAVLWLVKDMKSAGEKLKAGEVISLGSPSPQAAPHPGDTFTLIYEGLPGGPLQASVSFD